VAQRRVNANAGGTSLADGVLPDEFVEARQHRNVASPGNPHDSDSICIYAGVAGWAPKLDKREEDCGAVLREPLPWNMSMSKLAMPPTFSASA
jgi:hypothetical protein